MSASAQGTSVPSVFQFDSQEVRIFVDDQGEPWFCATDVCAVLGYQNAPDAIAKHCRQKGIAKRDTFTKKGQQSLTFINEGNVHRLILKSHKPEAERVADWLCDEVLPAIRKTGRYEAQPSKHPNARLEIETRADEEGYYCISGVNKENAAALLSTIAVASYEIADIARREFPAYFPKQISKTEAAFELGNPAFGRFAS